MRSFTPKAKQGALSLSANGGSDTPEQLRLRELIAPIVVMVLDSEREFSHGTLTIGRMPSSDVCLTDPLVSRRHARLLVMEDGTVALEDLHSANGVFLNGARVSTVSRALRDGDRVVVGTTEIGVFACRRPSSRRPSMSASAKRVSETQALRAGPRESEQPETERSDPLEINARFARRLAAAGKTAEAASLLSSHMHRVLSGVVTGLDLPEGVLERTTRSAIELYRWTHDCTWIDYVIELHLAARRVPSETSLWLLDTCLRRQVPFDRELLGYYVESLSLCSAELSPSQRTRYQRLIEIARER